MPFSVVPSPPCVSLSTIWSLTIFLSVSLWIYSCFSVCVCLSVCLSSFCKVLLLPAQSLPWASISLQKSQAPHHGHESDITEPQAARPSLISPWLLSLLLSRPTRHSRLPALHWLCLFSKQDCSQLHPVTFTAWPSLTSLSKMS